MKQKRTYRLFLEDIIESIIKIETYTKNLSYGRFSKDPKTIDAVVRNLEIIGEAAKHIPTSVRSKHAEVPWKKMVGLRNIVVHEYFGIDEKIIWEIVNRGLSDVKLSIIKILETNQGQFTFNGKGK
ncbi:MAG: DUF86 domain-containing protein [Bacteroidota bacterium]|nr:DUF86 domain-containing protein [Bacteroidota bacterium]